MSCISRLNIDGIQLPQSWKRMVVTFSGHGDRHYLYAKDDVLDLEKDIVSFLLPIKARELAHIQKLFFIDACRGDEVNGGVEISSYCLQSRGDLVSRGNSVPSSGNYLIACSTLLGMLSFESKTQGGCWMQSLTDQLLNQENIDKSIESILKKVNRILIDLFNRNGWGHLQQPEYRSSLNGEDIKLLKEALDIDIEHFQPQDYLTEHQHLEYAQLHGIPQQVPQQQYDMSPQQQLPQQQYDMPQQHTTSQQQYGVPQQQYGVPQQQYGVPQQQYGVPQQQYGMPQQQYGMPQQQYGVPQQQYGMPQQQAMSQQQYGTPQIPHVEPQPGMLQQQYDMPLDLAVRSGKSMRPILCNITIKLKLTLANKL